MWVYDGDCALGDEWAYSFLDELDNFIADHREEEGFDPQTCYYEVLEQWGEQNFTYSGDQERLVNDVSLETCLHLLNHGKTHSLKDAVDGTKFCIFVCESAFSYCIRWEDDSVEESIRSRRARKSMFESRRSTSRRAKARRIH